MLVAPALNIAPLARVRLPDTDRLPVPRAVSVPLTVTLLRVPLLLVSVLAASVPLVNVPVRLMPPVPVFCKPMTPVALMVPPILMAAVPTAAPDDASDADSVTPPARSMMPLITMLPPATRLKLRAVPAYTMEAPALSVMLLVACNTTLLTGNNVPLMYPAPIFWLPASSAKPHRLSAALAGAGVLPVTMVISVGSSNRMPRRPSGASVLTRPRNSNAPLPEVSTKPPSPPSTPPRALMLARKLVASSAHTITRPPLPLSRASALMTTLSPT